MMFRKSTATKTAKKPVSQESLHHRRVLLERRRTILTAMGIKADILTLKDRIRDEDQAQHSLDEFVSLRLTGLEYLQLRAVDEALERLAAGDYGVCQSCDEPIPPKRLEAIPWACYCVRCQERFADAPYRENCELPLGDEEAANAD
jgi:DnaK suppressor protein